jgi:hypothetical protein
MVTELPVPPTGKPFAFQLGDQRIDLLLVGDDVLDVGADGEAHEAFGELLGDVAQLADGVGVHLALGAGTHRPDLVAGVRDVVQHAGTGTVVILPVAAILQQRRVHVLVVVGYAALDCLAQSLSFSHGCLRKSRYN